MMRTTSKPAARRGGLVLFFAACVWFAPAARAQENLSPKGRAVYEQLKAFALTGGTAEARGLVLRRDRVEMTFDGTFHFAAPVEGRAAGAVFVGQGRFRAEAPPNQFEKENMRRLLGTEVFESDFKTAVLRFTDETAEQIGRASGAGGAADERAQKLAAELDARLLKETGANLSARVALSLLNEEKPGFFFAHFDGGKRERFSFVLDPQTRVPVSNFTINGGEKGLVFSYGSTLYGNDLWMAFYSQQDYARGSVAYSDTNDLVDVTHYDMDVDLREHKSRLRVRARVAAQVLRDGVRAVPFRLGESLPEFHNVRLNKQMRLRAVRSGGAELQAAQEDWEGGLTVFLPAAARAGQRLELEFDLEGDFMFEPESVFGCSYPVSNTDWYPRHGYLDRATFDLNFKHRKNRLVASVGARVGEGPAPDDKDAAVTQYRMARPVALATFALGPFERHAQTVKWDRGGEPIPVEFNSLPGWQRQIKEDFILAELDNSLRYFSVLFGKYPYPSFSAAFHPFGFGQGLPSLLMIPATDRDNKYTFSFVAHETAHQWWGNIVAWRSYRDQWLSEGFAEYSGALYTGLRDSTGARDSLIREMRESLKRAPVTQQGVGQGRLEEIGPLILGHRLNTKKTFGAYQTLIYHKGALVLRMLHFLLSNPATGDDKAFYDMMTDFVERHRDQFASTEDFRAVAGEHFARSPIAKRYGLKDLDWFFKQWVYQTGLPSYELEYQIQGQPDGSVVVRGALAQEGVPDWWIMPVPLVFQFGGNQSARGTVPANGPRTPFEIKLPRKPEKVELDPHRWVLSDKTSAKGG
jgi:hypothetical protein